MLISVKNPDEARVAARHPLVSIVDLKDPSSGALGFAGTVLANEVINAVREIRPEKQISIACGELYQWRLAQDSESGFDGCELEKIHWQEVSYVKVGLSGDFVVPKHFGRLQQFFERVPNHVRRVLVIYVDLFSPAQAKEMIREARVLNASVVLLDTFDKSKGNTLAHYSSLECQTVFRQAQSQNMTGVLAGSINISSLGHAVATGADLIGVRGAVCQNDDASPSEIRKNSLCEQRLDRFLDAASGLSKFN